MVYTKFNKSIFRVLLIVLTIGAGIFAALRIKKQVKKPIATVSPHDTVDQLTDIKGQLAQRETATWQQITNTTGITKNDVLSHKHNRRQAYRNSALKRQKQRIAQNPPLSEEMIKKAEAICKDHGLDPTKITIAPLSSPCSAACANDYTVFIDETRLSVYPKDAQRFAIAHELAHIKHEDSSFLVALKELLGTREQKLQYQLYKIFESHADLEALALGKSYADAGLSYSAYILKRDGSHNGGVQHPSPAERFEMAQQVHLRHA